ncbi:MAG TPA: ribulose-phosphate 3-epimerase [Thermomicrobiaceae bacterium]|nr:ribulose-phosphate 3-epimerase [Thermomicrobiaceae bacterium]
MPDLPRPTAGQAAIAPSILTADLARLADAVAELEAAGADYAHLDVMDGRFVPNISIGIPVVAAVSRVTRLPLDVHLMIVEPERYVEQFVQAGAAVVTVQVEACVHLNRVVQQIHAAGARAGVALNPATPLVAVEEILPFADLVLVMSVNPGFGGQEFIPSALSRVTRLRRMIDDSGASALIEVDGGIKASNVRRVVEAGADVIVAGSAVFAPEHSVSEGVAALRAALR